MPRQHSAIERGGMTQSEPARGAETLRDEIALGEATLDAIVPIMRHLLAKEDNSLFSDEIVARVRGMLSHVAWQLLAAHALAAEEQNPRRFADARAEALLERLIQQSGLIFHAHALAVEWRLTERLEQEQVVDPVISPWMRAMIGSEDHGQVPPAMQLLAAQARYSQAQRRMELPLSELPAELLHEVLHVWREYSQDELGGAGIETDRQLRREYDEGASRNGLLSRLVAEVGPDIRGALALHRSGVAIFISALAKATGHSRDVTAIGLHERQYARLVAALLSAGLPRREVEQILLTIHPDISLPENLAGRSEADAAGMPSGNWQAG